MPETQARYLPGLLPRRHPSLMSIPPKLPGTEMDDFDRAIIGVPVQLRIPVHDIQETKAALHKMMQTARECIYLLEHPDAVGTDRTALAVVRYRFRILSQEIGKTKRVKR